MINAEDILDILKQQDPISIVRVGDGECVALDMVKSDADYNLAREDLFYKQTGYILSDIEMKKVRDNLIESIAFADILGLPIQGQKSGPQWDRIRGAIKEHVGSYTKCWCDIDIHSEFLEKGYFQELIQHRNNLTYISCRNLDDKFNIPVNSFIVAPEWKFTSGYKGEHHYPEQFNSINNWVKGLNAKNNLLLYGAGTIGKIYGNWWRDLGGVAFDIGSVFDDWAGKVTRGEGRGADVNGGNYKL